MKHLKVFETTAAFDAAKSDIEKPWVALTEDSEKVHYAQGEPQPTYEMVDLGLPSGLKWAKYNIGATSETEYGDYFMWGSTRPNTEDEYDWAHAPFNNGASSFNETYFNTHKSEWLDGDVLKSEYDAATVLWGAGYRMPTEEDFDELLNNTNNEWVTDYNGSGVNGYLFRSMKDMDKYIFIPASGLRDDSPFDDRGSFASVWSSSHLSDYPVYSRSLYFISGDCYVNYDNRFSGLCVRPVSE